MPSIVIKDLAESVDLDREAMAAIAGGARLGGGPASPGPAPTGTPRLIHYPGGARLNPAPATPAAGAKASGR